MRLHAIRNRLFGREWTMITKIIVIVLCLTLGCWEQKILFAQTESQPSHTWPTPKTGISSFPVSPLDIKSKIFPEQAEIIDNSGFTIHLGGRDPKTNFFINPPCELILIDPQGRRLGYDPQKKVAYKEIPRASYETMALEDAESGAAGPETKELDIRQPLSGHYELQVIGSGTGTCSLEIRAYDKHSDVTSSDVKVMASRGAIARYKVIYSSDHGFPVQVIPSR